MGSLLEIKFGGKINLNVRNTFFKYVQGGNWKRKSLQNLHPWYFLNILENVSWEWHKYC